MEATAVNRHHAGQGYGTWFEMDLTSGWWLVICRIETNYGCWVHVEPSEAFNATYYGQFVSGYLKDAYNYQTVTVPALLRLSNSSKMYCGYSRSYNNEQVVLHSGCYAVAFQLRSTVD